MTSSVACPVCGAPAPFAYDHPDARIYRCRSCTHAFSDPASIREAETYSPEYYEVSHRNWFLHPNIRLFAWIERQLPADVTSVIDAGCGRGQFLDYLHEKRPHLRLVGVDLSRNEDRNGIEFHCGDASKLQLGTFDAVVSLATIEHVADIGEFAEQVRALCKPGGLAFVMTLDEGGTVYRAARLGRRLGVPVAFNRLYSSHHLHHFTARSLAELLERKGLRLRKTHAHGVPLRALDMPPVSKLARPVFVAAVASLFAAGKLARRSFLQTVIVERPRDERQ
jgi:2-polyprenyl-3-methyl-5-hydroxy-6-metoxy-1,4-benzoquinol methylase